MIRKSLSIGLLGALTATMAALPVAARAQYYGGGQDRYRQAPAYGYGDDGYRDRRGYREGHADRRADYDRAYYARGYDGRGYDGRHDRCRSDGTTGAVIGAIAGGLLGNSIAGYGDRAAGTVIGGVGGALAGRAVDRNC